MSSNNIFLGILAIVLRRTIARAHFLIVLSLPQAILGLPKKCLTHVWGHLRRRRPPGNFAMKSWTLERMFHLPRLWAPSMGPGRSLCRLGMHWMLIPIRLARIICNKDHRQPRYSVLDVQNKLSESKACHSRGSP